MISATNKALRREVAEGRFREDLSYRMRVVPLFLPPLRHRQGDVAALFWHFVDEMNQRGPRRIEGVTRPAMDAIRSYPWPGNVRELRSAVEYAFVVGEGPLLDIADLAPTCAASVRPGRRRGRWPMPNESGYCSIREAQGPDGCRCGRARDQPPAGPGP